MTSSNLTAAQRFEMKVDRSGECHRWVGARSSHGYGYFRYQGRQCRAHIVALLLAGVEIPDGMTVDHVRARGCQFRDCVRVDHLEVVTPRENALRSTSPPAMNAAKSHCIKGHEFTAENTVRMGAKRQCRTCKRARNAAYARRKRTKAA
jgi:hypothetical protein